jgi:hypothetical protein
MTDDEWRPTVAAEAAASAATGEGGRRGGAHRLRLVSRTPREDRSRTLLATHILVYLTAIKKSEIQ